MLPFFVVRYVMRCIFGGPKQAPPPLEKLTPKETVSFLWKGDGSLVDELLQCMSPYMDEDMLSDLKSKVCAHDASDCDDIQKALQKSLLWLRDEVRSLPCTYKCRHDAAADLIHVYACTKSFFRVGEYDAFTSPPVHISPLDLGPKCADKLGGLPHKYQKTYGGNYCMGQLIFWHVQTNTEPDFTLAKASKCSLSLPEIGSFYAKVQKPSQQRIYGPKTVRENDVGKNGEVPSETVAQGPNMVIQELSKSFWQPNARCCIEQCPTRQRNGTLAEAQAYSIPMKLLSPDKLSRKGWGGYH